MKSRKISGVKISVQKSLEATLSNRLKTSLDKTRSLDNPVLKASLVWEKTSDQLKDILGSQIHKQWFESVLPIVILDKILILECKNTFHAKWLNTHYRKVTDLLIGFQDKNLSSFFVAKSERKKMEVKA